MDGAAITASPITASDSMICPGARDIAQVARHRSAGIAIPVFPTGFAGRTTYGVARLRTAATWRLTRTKVKPPCACLDVSGPAFPHRCRAASTNPAAATSATATSSHGIGP